jgi:hypothetical protein
MQTHRCYIEFVKTDPEAIGQVMAGINKNLNTKNGKDYVYDLDIWWRQVCIDNDIYSHPEPQKLMSQTSNKIGIAWDGYDTIQEFIDIFFTNTYWLNIENEFLEQGWTKNGPTIIPL